MASHLLVANPNVLVAPTYALMVVEKPQTNHPLVAAIEDSIVLLAGQQSIAVRPLSAVGTDLTDHAEPQIAACNGKLFCIADEVSKGGIAYLFIARAMPSQVVSDGVVMQVLVLQTNTHKVLRKADMEVAVSEDAALAVRANFVGLFAQRWGTGRSRFSGLEEVTEDFKLRLARLPDNAPPTGTELQQLDDVVTDMEAIMAQLQGELYDMNRRALENWQQEHPAGKKDEGHTPTAAVQ